MRRSRPRSPLRRRHFRASIPLRYPGPATRRGARSAEPAIRHAKPGDFERAINALKRGSLVIFPTDTVTGLGCRAGDARAVRRIYALKGREKRKPLILFVESIAQAEKYTGLLAPRTRKILSALWPGAFTAVLPLKGRAKPGIGTGGTVGIRIPAHPAALRLVRALGGPLATTSANKAGCPPEPDAKKAGALLGGRVAVVNGRSGNIPSTVADLTRWPPVILRPGAVMEKRLRKLASRRP